MIRAKFFVYFGVLFFFSAIFLAESVAAKDYDLKAGDIVFQDLDCGDFCTAVKKVTDGVDGHDFSHMAILDQSATGEWVVYEAISQGVIATPYITFLMRSLDENAHAKVVVGRFRGKYKKLIPEALDWIRANLGKPYDEVFDLNNDKYYCSEMIHLAFAEANRGKAVFDVQPMTFKDPDTGKTFPVWQQYFKDLHAPIPEGEPGLNPGGMSKSKALKIVFDFSELDK